MNKNIFVYSLLGFGVLISASRFMATNLSAVGIDPFEYFPWLVDVEAWSGVALGLFEMFAFAYIAYNFKHISLKTIEGVQTWRERFQSENSLYWFMLLIGMVVLLITIPTIIVVHLAEQRFGYYEPNFQGTDGDGRLLTIWFIWDNFLEWAWLYIVAGVSTLFVLLIGLVHEDVEEEKQEEKQEEKEERRKEMQVPVQNPNGLPPPPIVREPRIAPKRQPVGRFGDNNG